MAARKPIAIAVADPRLADLLDALLQGGLIAAP